MCAQGHNFDRARSGYLNLLLSHRKQSVEPGDSPSMMQSRRAFLQCGYYDRMSDAASAAVARCLEGRVDPQVADLGSGEGYFTSRLQKHLTTAVSSSATCYGVDVSRPGTRMATTYNKEVHWVVASLHRSPFLPQSLDVALVVFAPIDASDVRRVIREDGALVTVTPGPDHLDGLRQLIYPSVRPHPSAPALMADDTLFTPSESSREQYSIAIDSPAQIQNLLAMTPYAWHIPPAIQREIGLLQTLTLTVDFQINVFRPKGDRSTSRR